MNALYVYRASDELAAALTARADEVRAWTAEVSSWDEAHPDTPMLWARSGLGGDRQICGFADKNPSAPPPDGLSRAQSRVELIPKRGRAGDAWREVMARFGKRPSIDEVLRDHDVETFVLVHAEGRSYTPGLLQDGATWWITCSAQLHEGDHLTAVPLSTYYAAREAVEGRRAAEVAS